jgi:hypothetical protein
MLSVAPFLPGVTGAGMLKKSGSRRPRGRGRRDLASVNERKQIDDTECSVRGRWESRPTNVTRSRHAAYHVFEPQRSQIGQRGVCCPGATAANGSKKRGGNGSKSEFLPTRTYDGKLAPRKGSSASHPYESLQRDGNEYGPHEVSCNELQCLTEVPGNRHAKWKAGGELSRRRAA